MSKKILFAFLFFVFAGCQKEATMTKEETATNRRLVKMIQGTHNGAGDDTTFTFFYDDAGTLVKLNYSGFGTTYDCFLHYDNQKRLVKIDGLRETEYTYNDQGRLKELMYVQFAAPHKYVFEYGTDTVPASAKEYDFMNGQWQEGWEQRYTYQNGNIVSISMYDAGTFKGKHDFQYYNNIPNNLKMLALLDMNYRGFGFYETPMYFNKNMPRSGDRDQDGYVIEYQLDSGSIVKSVGSWLSKPANDTGMKQTRFYYYEVK